ncbi:MAG TPA: SRPBCC family protein, partial [Natronosporangium sp.]
MTDQPTSAASGQLLDPLKQALRELLKVAGQRAIGSVTDRLADAGKKVGKQVVEQSGGLTGVVTKTAGGAVKKTAEKVKDAATGGGGDSSGGNAKVTNIVEEIDVGVPVRLAYDQWTRFTDFPGFMKQVENVDQESDTELKWRGKILWSHRDWKSTIIEQIPDKRIIWRSEGSKGYVNGAVTFHELAPELTRILVVLEYYPGGFFEKTANLWRAQGRRARLELKHFRRHVMTQAILKPEEVSGWRGEIHDAEVTKPHRD